MPTPLSVLYLSFNEAQRVRSSLEQVSRVADELVCVDSGSTDGTVALFKEFGADVYSRPLDNWGEQRNFGLDQCTNSWVLVLDCDEIPDENMIAAIKAWKQEEHSEDELWSLHRVHHFMGKRMKFSGLQNDHILRLMPKATRFQALMVHEKVVGKGTLIGGTLEHFSYENEGQWAAKIRSYAVRQAQEYDQRTGRITVFHFGLKPLFRFFKHYVLKGGIFDGPEGWAYSTWMYRAVLWRYQELRELRKTT